ncbi:hypothetical protein DL93DRAFT_2085577 [Clavulina sp. PMI_390]|nr:hypothetical protein DL93DRAFT_2085577 [Clavulina sp. PMI_390]
MYILGSYSSSAFLIPLAFLQLYLYHYHHTQLRTLPFSFLHSASASPLALASFHLLDLVLSAT